MRRRTDFEHRIASRATKPKDFLRYAEYEINVEKLRLKRVQRLGKEANENDNEDDDDIGANLASEETGSKRDKSKGKGISSYAGPRRIFFIFDRGTKKYPNEISLLWIPYIKFAKSQGAVFILAKIYSRLIQLHPTNPSVWIMAAKYELDTHNAIRAARSIMQQGLRFNATNATMWLEYMKLELIYVAQLLARRRILGLVTEAQQRNDPQHNDEDIGDDAKHQKDVIEMPTFDNDLEAKANFELKSLPDVDVNMLGNSLTNPALRGDIALLVFDSALPELVKYTTQNTAEKQKILLKFAEDVLVMITQFCLDYNTNDSRPGVESAQLDGQYLGTHIIESITRSTSSSSSTTTNTTNNNEIPLASIAYWDTSLPIRYLSASNPLFPDAIKTVLDRFTKKYIRGVYAKAPQKYRLDFASNVAEYLNSRFIPDQQEGDSQDLYNSSKRNKSQAPRKVEELEPNLALIVRGLIAKCKSQQ